MARECQNPAPKETSQSSAKNFFLPGDAFAQLHNLSSYMLFDGAFKTFVGSNSDPKHREFVVLILGPARGLTDTGAQQPVVGSSAAPRWAIDFSSDMAQFSSDVWWNRLSQGRASSGFPCWNRGRERSDAIPRVRGAHVDIWKTTVHSTADTDHDHAPVGSKHSNQGKRRRAGNRG